MTDRGDPLPQVSGILRKIPNWRYDGMKANFSRRTFLKAAAGATAAAGVSNIISFGDWLPVAEAAEVVKKASICGSCSQLCGMWIYVKRMRIVSTTGAMKP